MKLFRALLLGSLVLGSRQATPVASAQPSDAAVTEMDAAAARDIAEDKEEYDKEDERLLQASPTHSLPQGQVLFLGSSTFHKNHEKGILLTKLNSSFTVGTMSRALRGSLISETTHDIEHLVKPYMPRAIVFYAGENDVSFGATAEKVCDDFTNFVKEVRAVPGLENVPITYVSIKPSPLLFAKNVSDIAVEANDKIHIWINARNSPANDRLHYLNVWRKKMTGADRKPLAKYFKNAAGVVLDNERHMNKDGYELWANLLKHPITVMLRESAAPTPSR